METTVHLQRSLDARGDSYGGFSPNTAEATFSNIKILATYLSSLGFDPISLELSLLWIENLNVSMKFDLSIRRLFLFKFFLPQVYRPL